MKTIKFFDFFFFMGVVVIISLVLVACGVIPAKDYPNFLVTTFVLGSLGFITGWLVVMK